MFFLLHVFDPSLLNRSGCCLLSGTITLTVEAVNDPPIAVDVNFETIIDSGDEYTITLSGTDVDDSVLDSYNITAAPECGTLTTSPSGMEVKYQWNAYVETTFFDLFGA